MREIRSSGSAEGVMRNHDPYSDSLLADAEAGAGLLAERVQHGPQGELDGVAGHGLDERTDRPGEASRDRARE
jgi:hypothetical protein